MTGTREPQQDGSIQAMLRDSGLESAAELRSTLEELRALVPERAPAPRADLEALLAAGAPSAGTFPGSTTAMPVVASTEGSTGASASGSADASLPAGVTGLAARRGGRKRRLAIVGGAVVGAMTLGAGAVAASSEDFREHFGNSVGSIFQPSGQTPDVAPQPARPSPADIPAASVPSDPASATPPPSAADAAGGSGSANAVPAKPGVAATPPAVGRGGVLPTPPHRPVTPTVPGLPGPGEARSLPKDPTPAPALPGVPPTLPARP